MKRLVPFLFASLVSLLPARRADAVTDVLHVVSAATATDDGPQDGIYDAILAYNMALITNNGWTSLRTAFEFDLAGIPGQATIESATLSLWLGSIEGDRQIAVHGYGGDGTVQLVDFALDGLVGAMTVVEGTPVEWTFDVTPLVSGLLSEGYGYAGFNVREDPANTPNYLVMEMSLTAETPALVIEYTSNEPPVCTGAYPSIATIWPPNNKMVDVAILGVTDPDGDPVTITITSISNNETGAADAAGIGTPIARVRAARDGKGTGRIYTIAFTATDGSDSSSGTVTVLVPHDQGKGHAKPAAAPGSSWGEVKRLFP